MTLGFFFKNFFLFTSITIFFLFLITVHSEVFINILMLLYIVNKQDYG